MIRSHARQRTTPSTAGIRTLLHEPSQKGPVFLAKLGRYARGSNVDQAVRPLLVEPDNPVPQRLTVHSANPRRILTRCSIEHRRNRQKPPRLRGVLRPLGKPANLARRKVRPHRNSSAHCCGLGA